MQAGVEHNDSRCAGSSGHFGKCCDLVNVAGLARVVIQAGVVQKVGKPLIELRNITKSYQSTTALRDVSLTIGEGITGLLGPNGAGKSTLIKVLLGLVRLNQGTGSVLGHDLKREGRQIRSLVGFMPEDDCYFSGMTGIEMVQFSARLTGYPSVEALRRSHEILDFCGVHQERYRSVEGYSTGMRQKVKFAAAIVHDPILLILDEPTSGLDPEEREALLNRVKILCDRFHKSALISTHILPDVQQICDHVIILSNGQVRLSDRLDKLNVPSSPRRILAVQGDPAVLVSALERARMHPRLDPEGTVSVEADSPESLETIWATCRDHNIVLRSLVPTRNSLEEIFMNAIRGDGHAHS
jgi:ABC-2 type transport system ATP-binding protein